MDSMVTMVNNTVELRIQFLRIDLEHSTIGKEEKKNSYYEETQTLDQTAVKHKEDISLWRPTGDSRVAYTEE